jgi:DNA-binding response OmpR family regulator
MRQGGTIVLNQGTSKDEAAARSGPGGPSQGRVPHLLVVEPEALVRWSLGKYLSRWFVVHCVDSRVAAERVLEDHQVDAVIVSFQRSHRLADEVETIARVRNPAVRVIRTCTNASEERPGEPDALYVEKPFELAELAGMLGVTDARA